LKVAIGKQINEDPGLVKVIFQGKQLIDDAELIKSIGIPDANVDGSKFCVILVTKTKTAVSSVQVPTPASVSAPVPPPVSVQVPTPAPVPTPSTMGISDLDYTGDDGDDGDEGDEGDDALTALSNLGIDPASFTPETMITLLNDPKIKETILHFRMQNPMYVQAYQMFPEDCKALLENNAFALITLAELGSILARQNGLGGELNEGGDGRDIKIAVENEEEKEKLNQLVEMGFAPGEAIQYLRICDGDINQAASMMYENFGNEHKKKEGK
jgi:hypothetical protein